MAKKPIKPKYTLLLRQDGTLTIHDAQGQQISEGKKPKGPVALVDLGQHSVITDVSDSKISTENLLKLIHTDPASIIGPQGQGVSAGGIAGKDDRGNNYALVQMIGKEELQSLTDMVAERGLSPVAFDSGLFVAYRLTDKNVPTALVQPGPKNNILLAVYQDTIFRLQNTVAVTEQGQEDAVGALYGEAVELFETLYPATELRVHLIGDTEFNRQLQGKIRSNNINAEIIPEDLLIRESFKQDGSTIIPEKVAAITKNPSPLPSWMPIALGLAAGLIPYAVLSAQNSSIRANTEQMTQKLAVMRPQLDEHGRLTGELARINAVQLAARAITENRVDWNGTYDKLLSKLPQGGNTYTLLFTSLSADAGLSPISTTDENGLPIASMPAPPQPTFNLTAVTKQRGEATKALESLERNYDMDMRTLRQDEDRWVLEATLVDTGNTKALADSTPPSAPAEKADANGKASASPAGTADPSAATTSQASTTPAPSTPAPSTPAPAVTPPTMENKQ